MEEDEKESVDGGGGVQHMIYAGLSTQQCELGHHLLLWWWREWVQLVVYTALRRVKI